MAEILIQLADFVAAKILKQSNRLIRVDELADWSALCSGLLN